MIGAALTERVKFWVTLTELPNAAMPAAQGADPMVNAEATGLVVELS